MNKPVLRLSGEVDVEVTRLSDYKNDEVVKIFIDSYTTGESVGVILNYEDVQALIGFLRGDI